MSRKERVKLALWLWGVSAAWFAAGWIARHLAERQHFGL